MNPSLRILFTVHGYKPAYNIGGPIFSVSNLAETLVRKGNLVTVFTTNRNMSEELDVPVNCPQMVEGVEVWYFRTQEYIKKILPFVSYLSKSMGYLFAPEMAKQLNITVPSMDLVHTHLPFIYPTYAAARAARLHNKPLFYNQRGVLCPDHLIYRSLKKKVYLKLIERKILKNATSLIGLTNYEYESYVKLGIDTKCYIIPNGIYFDQYSSEKIPSVESGLGLSPDAMVVLFMGRLHPMKGVDRLLDAFFRIHSFVPKVNLVIAGPDEYGLIPKWRDKIRKSGLDQYIFFPGIITGEIKRNLLARADLFCLPSDAEGFSVAILEALASGTAVMISPGCHFPEVEKAGVGIVVETEPEAIAKGMIQLLNDRGQLEEMGRKGRELVSRNYSWDAIANKMIDAYQEGIDRHSIAIRL
jgi:glycosyltransferase involved in cell wall biosynthesis